MDVEGAKQYSFSIVQRSNFGSSALEDLLSHQSTLRPLLRTVIRFVVTRLEWKTSYNYIVVPQGSVNFRCSLLVSDSLSLLFTSLCTTHETRLKARCVRRHSCYGSL